MIAFVREKVIVHPMSVLYIIIYACFWMFFKTKLVFFYGLGKIPHKFLWWEGGAVLPVCQLILLKKCYKKFVGIHNTPVSI